MLRKNPLTWSSKKIWKKEEENIFINSCFFFSPFKVNHKVLTKKAEMLMSIFVFFNQCSVIPYYAKIVLFWTLTFRQMLINVSKVPQLEKWLKTTGKFHEEWKKRIHGKHKDLISCYADDLFPLNFHFHITNLYLGFYEIIIKGNVESYLHRCTETWSYSVP